MPDELYIVYISATERADKIKTNASSPKEVCLKAFAEFSGLPQRTFAELEILPDIDALLAFQDKHPQFITAGIKQDTHTPLPEHCYAFDADGIKIKRTRKTASDGKRTGGQKTARKCKRADN